jgi:hypothetical protein
LNPIIDFLNYITKPENHLLLVSNIGVVVTALCIGISVLMYLLKRKNIPKLAFDWIWKESNYKGKSSVYCLKVKRNNGESNTDSGSKIRVYYYKLYYLVFSFYC